MDVEVIPRFLQTAPFRRVVWVAPIAYAVHILEEFWRFPLWVNSHFTPGYTTATFVIANAIIMVALVGLTATVSVLRANAADFLYFCWLSGQLFHNALFHLGTTAYFGVYSPGLLSAILLYLPVSYYIARAAHRENRIGNTGGFAALAVGAAGMFSLAYFGLIRDTATPE